MSRYRKMFLQKIAKIIYFISLEETMNICLGCGYTIDDGSDYCDYCSSYMDVDKLEARDSKVYSKVRKMKRDKPKNKKMKSYDRYNAKYEEVVY